MYFLDSSSLWYAGVPYELTPEFLEDLFTKHRIDYVVHGDDPCLLPDGTDAYAHAKQMGRFKMVRTTRRALLLFLFCSMLYVALFGTVLSHRANAVSCWSDVNEWSL